jgi:hypothetical protein
MKKIIPILLLSFFINNTYAQLKLFGIDISKQINYPDSIFLNHPDSIFSTITICKRNPYFNVEKYHYSHQDSSKTIVFSEFKGIYKPQTLPNWNKYLPKIKKYVSKSFGNDIKLFCDESLTIPDSIDLLWVKKYNDKYLLASITFDNRLVDLFFIIMIYNSKEELVEGLKHDKIFCPFSGKQYDRRIRYYDCRLIENSY